VACAGGSDVCPPRHRAPAAPCALRTHVALLVRPCSAKKKGPSFFICRGGHTSLPPPHETSPNDVRRSRESRASNLPRSEFGRGAPQTLPLLRANIADSAAVGRWLGGVSCRQLEKEGPFSSSATGMCGVGHAAAGRMASAVRGAGRTAPPSQRPIRTALSLNARACSQRRSAMWSAVRASAHHHLFRLIHEVALNEFDAELPEHGHGVGVFDSFGDGADLFGFCLIDQVSHSLL
jgi:hypothetical protein